jgi:hypothetical protein
MFPFDLEFGAAISNPVTDLMALEQCDWAPGRAPAAGQSGERWRVPLERERVQRPMAPVRCGWERGLAPAPGQSAGCRPVPSEAVPVQEPTVMGQEEDRLQGPLVPVAEPGVKERGYWHHHSKERAIIRTTRLKQPPNL